MKNLILENIEFISSPYSPVWHIHQRKTERILCRGRGFRTDPTTCIRHRPPFSKKMREIKDIYREKVRKIRLRKEIVKKMYCRSINRSPKDFYRYFWTGHSQFNTPIELRKLDRIEELLIEEFGWLLYYSDAQKRNRRPTVICKLCLKNLKRLIQKPYCEINCFEFDKLFEEGQEQCTNE